MSEGKESNILKELLMNLIDKNGLDTGETVYLKWKNLDFAVWKDFKNDCFCLNFKDETFDCNFKDTLLDSIIFYIREH